MDQAKSNTLAFFKANARLPSIESQILHWLLLSNAARFNHSVKRDGTKMVINLTKGTVFPEREGVLVIKNIEVSAKHRGKGWFTLLMAFLLSSSLVDAVEIQTIQNGNWFDQLRKLGGKVGEDDSSIGFVRENLEGILSHIKSNGLKSRKKIKPTEIRIQHPLSYFEIIEKRKKDTAV